MRVRLLVKICIILSALMFSIGTAFVSADISEGLIGCWNFNNPDNLGEDSSGNSNDAALVNDPLSIDGALEFDSANEQYAEVVLPQSENDFGMGESNFTVIACFKVEEWTGIGYDGIVFYGSIWGDGYGLSRYSTGDKAWFRCGGNDVPADDGTQPNGFVPTLNTWYYVAGVREKNGTDEKLSFYVNGELMYEKIYPSAVSNISTRDRLYFGRLAVTTNRYFNGMIDEVRIYNRVLTATEIEQLASAFSPPPVNRPPDVNAGYNQVIERPDTLANLSGVVTDDSLPDPPGAVTYIWTVANSSTSAIVTFGDAAALNTTAEFSADGTYVLHLTADDGEFQVSDDITISVEAPAGYVGDVYYVDAINGNDNHDGSATAPWQTMAKVNSFSYVAGDTVLLKRGNTWTGNSHANTTAVLLPKSNVNYGAYGSGSDPVLDGDSKASVCDIFGPTNITLDHLRMLNQDEANPASGWMPVLRICDSITAGGIPNIIVTNCEIHEAFTTRVVEIRSSNNCIIDRCNIYGNRQPDGIGSVLQILGSSNNVISNCEIHDTATTGGDVISVQYDSDNNRIEHNEVYGPAENGIYIRAADPANEIKPENNYIGYNYIHDIDGIGIQIRDGCSYSYVYYNILVNNDGPAIQSDGIYGHEQPGEWIPPYWGRVDHTYIYNNFIYNTGSANGIHITARPGQNVGTEVKNNIVISYEGDCFMLDQNSHSSGVVSDNNCFFKKDREDDESCILFNGTLDTELQDSLRYSCNSISDYQAISGQDAHSIGISPGIVNMTPTTYTDTALMESSPCINVGTSVGITEDFIGTAVPQDTAPDIGALEYVTNVCPMVALDMDGNSLYDIVVDFGNEHGIWAYMNNGSWEQVHNLSCASMQKADLDEDPKDDLIIDFGGEHGIWMLKNNKDWEMLHPLSAEQIEAVDRNEDGIDEIIIDFGGEHGIWEYDPQSQMWTQLHAISPESIGAVDDGTIVIDFGQDYGVWALAPDDQWMLIHELSPEFIEIADIDNDDMEEGILDFGEHGIWILNVDIWEWTQLHHLSPSSITPLNIDGQEGKDLVINFGPEHGIWTYYNDSSWNQLHPVSPKWIIGGNLDNDENKKDDLIIDFGPEYGIWKNENQSADWQKIHDLSV